MQEYDDKLIREVISNTPASKLSELINEYIHNARNKDISRRKILDDEVYREIALDHDLTIRRWTCTCGAEHDRDVNAARNIRKEGIRVLKNMSRLA